MKKINFKSYLRFNLTIFFTFLVSILSAQQKENNSNSNTEIQNYKKDVEQLISFVEFTFNLIGGNDATAKEKETIFNESFLKIFLNDKIQIEDDLDEKRDININKNIQAYLKDIDFFFKEVKFKYSIQEINHYVNDKNQLYFVATLNRNLTGRTIAGDSVNTNRTRYIEINVDDDQKILKVASIYTDKINELEDLANWWSLLPPEWKNIFGRNIQLADSIKLSDVTKLTDSLIFVRNQKNEYLPLAIVFENLKRITKSQEINLSNNSNLNEGNALSKLSDLRTIDISNTHINDLLPIRNLTKLESLDCSKSSVSSLSPLKYATNLKSLICGSTQIKNLDEIENFSKLLKLDISNTTISSLDNIRGLNQIRDLRINNTQISDLEPVKNLTNIEVLDISSTKVNMLDILSSLKNLKVLFCNNIQIYSLKPLDKSPALQKIYCDYTGITKEEANKFMVNNPNCLVIYETEELDNWWKRLSKEWKEIFNKYVTFTGDPSKEQLHQIANIEKLDLSGNKKVTSLEPLSKLINLESLNCSNTQISNLNGLSDIFDLKILNCSATNIDMIEPLRNLKNLEQINLEGTGVSILEPISSLSYLKILNVDYTPLSVVQLNKDKLNQFIASHPECLVIYRTRELENWWKGLSEEWKKCLDKYVKTDISPTKEQLHRISVLKELEIIDTKILNLNPLVILNSLHELNISGNNISDIKSLSNLKYLEKLTFSRNPVSDLTAISNLKKLTYLDFENTQVEELDFIGNLNDLQILKFSGTKVKSLKPLSKLKKLTTLEFVNTDVKTLKDLGELPRLELIKCGNTRISDKRIEEFKNLKPKCQVLRY